MKSTKFDFGCGSAPGPARRAYSAPPDPMYDSSGATSKGGGGRTGGKGKGEEMHYLLVHETPLCPHAVTIVF